MYEYVFCVSVIRSRFTTQLKEIWVCLTLLYYLIRIWLVYVPGPFCSLQISAG